MARWNLELLATSLALAAGSALCNAQGTAPMAPIGQPGEPAPKPDAKPAKASIYDESANASTQIAAAVAKAAKDNRRVLIQWGANWCGWCHMLHTTFATDPAIKKKLLYEYDVVLVDVGQFDKNLDLAAKYGADFKKGGLPYLTILDSDGKVVTNQETGALELKGETKPGHDPAKVLAFLTGHQATYQQANGLLSAGLQQAKRDHKEVFLHFGAPWCIWCHRLEDWMAKPGVASILAKDFVDVKIDQDRNPGAADIFKRYNPKLGGIPWFAVLDENGKVICTSDGDKGTIGFPADAAEIGHFAKMMTQAKKNMTDSDITALKESLETDNKTKTGH